ncbi:MAG: XTP/dITP diphosphatase [Nitrospiraceae bacterium]|nr:MAG: XTP/dITP diphosphatase [Nitrospiraceae bacterium]
MTVVLATRNKKKITEIKRICSDLRIRILTLDAFPDVPAVEEDGATFRANAVKKALEISKRTGYPAIADDSGLEVDALDGQPGVYSARYAGIDADDRQNVKKLLSTMHDIPDEKRGAHFVCCIAFAMPNGRYRTFTGSVSGVIGRSRKGVRGFGYDPVFYPEGRMKTFAQMTDHEKDSLSHRGRALGKLHAYLSNLLKIKHIKISD